MIEEVKVGQPFWDIPCEVLDYATGVKGSFVIGRSFKGTWEFWNPDKWAGFGYVFEDKNIAGALCAAINYIGSLEAERRVLPAASQGEHTDLLERVKALAKRAEGCIVRCAAEEAIREACMEKIG